MSGKNFYFAGGGTGGHIYPGIAVAEELAAREPGVGICFFCSAGKLDKHIAGTMRFECRHLPARRFSLGPGRLLGWFWGFLRSYRVAARQMAAQQPVGVVGVGGFVSVPVCLAAWRQGIPIWLINVDIVPGLANRLISRWAKAVFVQFERTRSYFGKYGAKVEVSGCPVRRGFSGRQGLSAIENLGLSSEKKTLVVTGASSGSEHINEAVCSLLGRLTAFGDQWQIVHLTGMRHLESVQQKYAGAEIGHRVLGYFDDMAGLLRAADLVVGRSGAVSVAEYAAAGVPSICMPYPYHKDRHQYLNAGQLVQAGSAVLVEDLADAAERAEMLWARLEELMTDGRKRRRMAGNCRLVGGRSAARRIAEVLLGR